MMKILFGLFSLLLLPLLTRIRVHSIYIQEQLWLAVKRDDDWVYEEMPLRIYDEVDSHMNIIHERRAWQMWSERSHRSESDLLWKLRWHEKKSFHIYERNFISWQESWKLCGKVWVVYILLESISTVCACSTLEHMKVRQDSPLRSRYIAFQCDGIKSRWEGSFLLFYTLLLLSGWRELRQPHNRLYPVKVNRVFISSSFLCVFHSLLTFAFARRFRLFYSGLKTFKFIQIHSSSAHISTSSNRSRIIKFLCTWRKKRKFSEPESNTEQNFSCFVTHKNEKKEWKEARKELGGNSQHTTAAEMSQKRRRRRR